MLDENTTFRLNEIIRKFFKQFASKKDTTRAFDQIEMKLMDTVGGSQVDTAEDEALFTKIPLGRGSCASCGHKLSEQHQKQKPSVGPYGLKLPVKDHTERLSSFGKGFSRHLSMLNLEQVSPSDQIPPSLAKGQRNTS